MSGLVESEFNQIWIFFIFCLQVCGFISNFPKGADTPEVLGGGAVALSGYTFAFGLFCVSTTMSTLSSMSPDACSNQRV